MITSLFLGLGLSAGCIVETLDTGKLFYCEDNRLFMKLNNEKIQEIKDIIIQNDIVKVKTIDNKLILIK